MSGLNMAHKKFDSTPKDKFQDRRKMIWSMKKKKVKNEFLVDEVEGDFSPIKKSIDMKKYENPTETLATTFFKTVEKKYIWKF